MLGMEQLSPADRNVVASCPPSGAFSHPAFFTTEQFTGLKGKLVSLEDALDGCERILQDEFKDYPESALYMIGTVAEVKGKVKNNSLFQDSSKLESKTHANNNHEPAVKSQPNAEYSTGTHEP